MSKFIDKFRKSDSGKKTPSEVYHDTVEPQLYPMLNGEKVEIYNDAAAEPKEDDAQSRISKSEDRGTWSGQMDFLMSMIAYAVGLGNVWRFPYLCFKNGGGTFLVVYFFFWAIGAVPVFLLEVTAGQYLQKGGIEIWNVCPIFKGVGLGNVVIAYMCVLYYCIIITWALYYLVSSFTATFPWETCDNWWNNWRCIAANMNITLKEEMEANLTIYNTSSETSVEQFWEKRVLQQTDNIEDIGHIQWELLIVCFVAWAIIYFALWKGITEARKFIYFCALSPYFILVVLFVRGVTLPGAWDGISYYITPNISKLATTTVWKDAGTQVFYSYGVGFGALIALGSHNKFNHNCYRDALVMCVINGCTSLFAGLVVFSVLGYMSHIAGKTVADVVKPGVGLAFLAYPEVAVNLPLKQLWACLFFIMLTILGIDSQVCMVEGATTALQDMFPKTLRKRKELFLLAVVIGTFILGIPMLSQSGNYWLTLIDAYGPSGIALLWVVFFEVVGLSWGFGADKVSLAMQEMLGFRPCRGWEIFWRYISPASCVVLFVFLVIRFEPLSYPDGRDFPEWSLGLGILLSLASMLCIPGYAIYFLITAPGNTFMERWRLGFTSNVQTYKHGVPKSEMKELQVLNAQ